MAEKADSQMLYFRLFKAIDDNDIENVRMCIKERVDLNKTYYSVSYDEVMCPLALACCLGHEEIMEELLKAGASPNQVSGQHHMSAMLIAAWKRVLTLSTMRWLISHGADIDFRDIHNRNILHFLARGQFSDTRDNMLSLAKLVLDNGVSFYKKDELGYTPLYDACDCGNIDLVKLFIAEGADVNSGRAMLSLAAEACNIDLFDLLLNAGAKKHLPLGALYIPCFENNHALIEKILNTCDVDINLEIDKTYMRLFDAFKRNTSGPVWLPYGCGDHHDLTILHHACADRRVTSKTVRLLLDYGADVRAVTDSGDTALHYAVWRNSCYKIRQLLSFNPPLNIKNKKNQTPFLKFIHRLKDIQSAPYDVCVLIFKMFIAAADGKLPADVEQELIQLRPTLSEAQRHDFEISSEISLSKMCRSAIRETIRVPFGSNVCKLPIPKTLQQYLKIPELDSVVSIKN